MFERQVRRPRATKDANHEIPHSPPGLGQVRSVRHQTTIAHQKSQNHRWRASKATGLGLRVVESAQKTPARVSGFRNEFFVETGPASQPYGLVDALDGDDSIGVINEPNEGPYFGSRIFPSIGLPTADGARVLKII